MGMLGSRRLQELIEKIDDSENKFDELEKELSGNQDFSNFMLDLFKVMGYYDEAGNFLE